MLDNINAQRRESVGRRSRKEKDILHAAHNAPVLRLHTGPVVVNGKVDSIHLRAEECLVQMVDPERRELTESISIPIFFSRSRSAGKIVDMNEPVL